MSQRLTLPVVLVGMPGAGKSHVGRGLARALGVPHVDTDALVEEEEGVAVSTIFAEQGEVAFREKEARAVERALGMRAIVSLGGGAVVTARVRELLRGVSVVHIDVDHEELVRRTAGKGNRPLLRVDPEGTLALLRHQRARLYEEVASVRVHSDARPVQRVIDQIAAMIDTGAAPRVVEVGGAAPSRVVIGRDLASGHVAAGFDTLTQKVLLVHARPVAGRAQQLAEDLRKRGYEVETASHPDAEEGKRLEVVASLWDTAGRMRLGRKDAVVAMGGGATTDMAGFAAATWLRGVRLVNVPTTLLAMVDAAVGGKTGINTAQGKNLVGAFHSASRVVCDLAALDTLGARDLAAGMAEVVKCGFIRDTQILRLVSEAPAQELADPASPLLAELVRRSVAVKAEVVGADPHESGLREILNYGHTLAHAIERTQGYTWRHGDAVAVGCVFAAHLARARGMLDEAETAEHEELFGKAGLPTRFDGAPLDQLVAAMRSDKKVRRGVLRFVLLDGIGNPQVHVVEPGELEAAARSTGIPL